MTDERLGDDLWRAIGNLPRGSGIVFRHYQTPLAERRRLFAAVQRVADARGLVLVRAGRDRLAAREDGLHNARQHPAGGLSTRAVHSRADARAAARAGVDLVFVSPVYPTRSHPDAPGLGLTRARRLARAAGVPAIALGGIDPSRGLRLMRLGFHGWAAIDAWTRG